MFGLGPTELIVILILGVLLLGPQRIPEAASSLGKAIRSFRRATRELREQIDIEDEVRRPLEDLRSALRDEPPPYEAPKPRLISPPAEQIHSTAPEATVPATDAPPAQPPAAPVAVAAAPAQTAAPVLPPVPAAGTPK